MTQLIANYECTALKGTNKVGNLKVDGLYREINLGAFDGFNHGGVFYPFTQKVKSLFATGGDVRRRLDNGKLRSELGHPKFETGQRLEAVLARIRHIEMNNVCAHIRNVRLEKGKDHKGRNLILAIGEVAPSGVKGDQLEKSFNNTDENVSFSVRSITLPRVVKGVLHKCIQDISTWDQVHEDGIPTANKFDTPSLESISDNFEFTAQQMELIPKDAIEEYLGQEAVESFTYVKTALGWDKIQVTSPSLNWKN